MSELSLIKRENYLSKLFSLLGLSDIKILTGLRRCGKTTLLLQLKEELIRRKISEDNIIYLDFEKLEQAVNKIKDVENFIIDLTKDRKDKIYFLFDELSVIDYWENVVSDLMSIVNCEIFIASSNAYLFHEDTTLKLPQNYIEIRVNPLDFKEYLTFVKLYKKEANLSLEDNYHNILRYGSLPGIFNLPMSDVHVFQYLDGVFSTILLNDVLRFRQIRDLSLLLKIFKFIIDNLGKNYSPKNIADFMRAKGIKLSTQTIYTYLDALESAYLIYRVKRYDIKAQSELELHEKYYISDLGFNNALIGPYNDNVEFLLENLVFIALKNSFAVYTGKLGKESIDFISDNGENRKYYQITNFLTEDNAKREFSPLENVKDNFEKTVIASNKFINSQYNGILQKNIIDFLLEE